MKAFERTKIKQKFLYERQIKQTTNTNKMINTTNHHENDHRVQSRPTMIAKTGSGPKQSEIQAPVACVHLAIYF